MNLENVIRNINSFNPEHTIYVKGAWIPQAEAVVCLEPSNGQVPEGFEYFLEVFLVQELIEDSKNLTVQRIIEYAQNDA
ncbi:hypothetical protein IFO68_17970 [Photobacterium sp. CAU 1568]|uniref:Phage protein n=1 Tax=Photobacterium arenosum TaxID=2774143 RepID=A0ABR9BPZ4_9GAMM|nr:hypothetical protein [Photobacterium arenosum]MBD8514572.1 hypothetical protein [Photobacterium arenosum]